MSDGTSRLAARAASASPQLSRETNQAEAAGEADEEEEAAGEAAAEPPCSARESSEAASSESMLGAPVHAFFTRATHTHTQV